MSLTPFQGLNMSTSNGDTLENVTTNRQLFLSEISIAETQLAQAVQISRDGIGFVDAPGIYANRDALITQQPGVYLSILTADCSPLLLWSRECHLVAAVHSGWQGSELDILGQTIDEMVKTFEISPASLSMVIGPGLSQDYFEVGPEFSNKFSNEYLRRLPGSDRFHLDNNRYLRDTAIKNGILENQIEILSFCSFRDNDLFFSHRRDKGMTGRMISVIGMNE